MPDLTEDVHEVIVAIAPEHRNFIDKVRVAMETYFHPDRRRIDHALAVAGHARKLLGYVDADPVLTLTVAYLHDIGIHEAERRHGSNAGNFQELEGPAVARRILEELDANPQLIETACRIIGTHHTPGGVAAPEFRILWDADALVNFTEMLPGRPAGEVEAILRRHMATEAGYRAARRLFLGADFPG